MTPSRIGVVVHPHRTLDDALGTLHEWAGRHGEEVVQIRVEGQERQVAPFGDAESCNLIAALGGDGTTLAALHAAAPHGLPVLGVACGSLGALTATSASELAGALERFADDDWQERKLPGVAVTIDDAEPQVALNDLVVVRKGANQVIVGVEVGDERYVRFAGDGVVIATPLGSSAYTMAAGGPVLASDTPAIVVTPVAAHGGSTPPLVVGPESPVRVTIEGGWGGARVELDGQIRDHEPQELRAAWHPDYATLVRFEGAETLLAGLRRRRILQDSPRVLARDDRTTAADGPSG
jgi:NAD+ kinase